MRMNKYLASTLFTGLFISAAYFTPAMGQEQSLQPQGSWAITKIDRSAEGGNSYCTLSRKYDEGVVLSLGRNQTEEYSLAIDFQKPVFEKDKSLKINLQPGPGQIRAYDMMPTSEKAVVIRLGWDTGFFDALNQSQQMKVKIADKGYSFAMPEITKGQGDLQTCMEGLQSAGKPAKGDKLATKDVLDAEPVKASKDFEAAKATDKLPTAAIVAAQKADVAAQEKGVLAKFADSMTAQETSANGDDAPKRKNFNTKVAETEKVAPEEVKVASNDKTVAPPPPELIRRPPPSDKALPQAVATQKKDETVAAELAKTAPAAEEKLPPVAPVAVKADPALESRLKQLEAENEALKQKTAKAVAAPKNDAELEKLQAEKKLLQERLEQAKQEKEKLAKPEDMAAVAAKAKELEIKNQQLEDSLRQSQVRIAETAVNTESKALRKIADLEVKLAAAQKDNANLAKQLDSQKLQQEDGRLTAVAGDWDLENATKRYNEAEREIRRLAQQLEQERTSCNREKAEIEQMLFDPAVADRQQIERLSKLEDDLNAAQAKLADQQKQVQEAVSQQLAVKAQAIEAEKAAAAAQIASLQKSLADREAAVATLQKTAQESKTAATDNDILTRQLGDMQKLVAAKDQEIASLKKEPDQSQEVVALNAHIKKLADTLVAKDKALAEFAAAPKADPSLQKSLTDLQASQAALKAESDTMRDQNIVLRNESEKLRLQLADAVGNGSTRADRVASMQLEMDNLKRQIQMKDTQNATYQNQIAVLQQESTQLKNRLTVSDDSSEVGALSREVQELKKQISAMDRLSKAKPVADRSASATQFNAVQPAAGTSVYTQSATSATYGAGDLQNLLQKSGISAGGLQKASSGFSGADNFAWTDSSIKGLASVKAMGGTSFDTMVDQYIGYQRGQCGSGDFASMPSPSNGSATKRMALYEIACVSGGNSTSSSLIFFEDQGRFIAIANEIGAADMDIAMDSRDRIAGFVRGL